MIDNVAKIRPGLKSKKLPTLSIIYLFRVLLFLLLISVWQYLIVSKILPEFFFGRPSLIFNRILDWFASGMIYPHLITTLIETIFAFIIGVIGGSAAGLWLGLSPLSAAMLDPYVKALNAMPRVILAPIFLVWFGLGMGSKIALGITLVFCVVFFNVFQGVKEVNNVVLANAKVLGATSTQLLKSVYVPSALSWMFSSLHTAVGMAFVGAVVGEYLGSASGIGYLILQAESVFDINAVLAGILVLTIFALILDWIVSKAEKRLLNWSPNHE